MRERPETMEQHRNELDHDNHEEKEDQYHTDGLEMQVLLGNDDLERKRK